MTNSFKFFAPNYFSDFKCIGSDCEDNCCQGWNINVDSESVKKYELYDKNHNTSFRKSIITTDNQLHHFSLKDDGTCSVLDENGLCNIFKEMGQENLCYTCTAYPRTASVYKESKIVDLSLSLSCPEVVRKAILTDKKITYNEIKKFTSIIRATPPSRSKNTSDIMKHKIVSALITLIHNQSTSINQRMTALLLISFKADALDILESNKGTKELLDTIRNADKTNLKEIEKLPPFYERQFEILVSLLRGVLTKETGNSAKARLYEIAKKSFSGIGISDLSNIKKTDVDTYIKCQKKYVSPYFEKNPHILENLMSHYISSKIFPFHSESSVLESFLKLAVLQLVFTGLLGGYAHYHGKIDDEKAKDLIYIIYRSLTHNQKLQENITTICKELKAVNLANLYTMFAR